MFIFAYAQARIKSEELIMKNGEIQVLQSRGGTPSPLGEGWNRAIRNLCDLARIKLTC